MINKFFTTILCSTFISTMSIANLTKEEKLNGLHEIEKAIKNNHPVYKLDENMFKKDELGQSLRSELTNLQDKINANLDKAKKQIKERNADFFETINTMFRNIGEQHLYLINPYQGPANLSSPITVTSFREIPFIKIHDFAGDMDYMSSKLSFENDPIIVIDLRDNAGGLLSNVRKVMKMIYGEDPIVPDQELVEYHGKYRFPLVSDPKLKDPNWKPKTEKKFVFLFNEKTMSASMTLMNTLYITSNRNCLLLGPCKITEDKWGNCLEHIINVGDLKFKLTCPIILYNSHKTFTPAAPVPESTNELLEIIDKYNKMDSQKTPSIVPRVNSVNNTLADLVNRICSISFF